MLFYHFGEHEPLDDPYIGQRPYKALMTWETGGIVKKRVCKGESRWSVKVNTEGRY